MKNNFRLLCGALCFWSGSALAAATPKKAVDFDFGSIRAAWKADGREVAVQSTAGVAIRDASTGQLKRFLSAKTLGITGSDYLSLHLVAWCSDDLVLASPPPESNGVLSPASLPGPAALVAARDGHRVKSWNGVVVSPDRQTLFFSSGQGRFRVLNFAARRWFSVRLPLRETSSKAAQVDPDFPKNWEGWPSQILFSPDGQHAADQMGDGRMRLWDVKAAKVSAILRDKVVSGAYPAVTGPVVWSPDGRQVATLGENPAHRNFFYDEGPNDGTINEHPAVIKIWDARSGALLQWFSVADPSRPSAQVDLKWLDNDRLFAGATNTFQVRSVSRHKIIVAPQLKEDFQQHGPYALAPDHARLFANRRFFFLGGQHAGWPTQPIFRAPPALADLAWSRDGRFLAASFNGASSGVEVWKRDDKSQFSLAHLASTHESLHLGWTRSNRVWSSDLYRISFWRGSENWRPEIWKAPFIGRGKAENPTDSPPANSLFAMADDQTKLHVPDRINDKIYRWNKGGTQPQLLLDKTESGGSSSILSPDERFLSFWKNIDNNLYLRMVDLQVPGHTLQLLHPIVKDAGGDTWWDLAPRFSGDGKRLAWGARVWELTSGKPLSSPARALDGIALAFNAHGTSLLRGGPKGLRFFAPLSGKPTRQLAADADGIGAAVWSPDGRFIAAARRNVIEIYDVKANRLVTTLFAWPSTKTTDTARDPHPDWLSFASQGEISGSARAKTLVRVVR